jgi:hypothetical protein
MLIAEIAEIAAIGMLVARGSTAQDPVDHENWAAKLG